MSYELMYAEDRMNPELKSMGLFSDRGLRSFERITVADESTRRYTNDGYLKVKAVLTRPGEIKYTRKELKKDGDGWVTVYRSPESVAHPETLSSMDGAPVTMGHPKGGLTTKNSKCHVVGSLTNPEIREDGYIVGDLTIWNGKAIRDLENGQEDVSIGYDFHLDWIDPYQAQTIGPMRVNHVAIVKEGRAGQSVRVMDSLDEEEITMDAAMIDQIAERVATRVYDGQDGDADIGSLVRAEMEDVYQQEEAQNRAYQFAQQIVDDTKTQERTRHRLITDAMPLLDHNPELQQALPHMETRDILMATIGEDVPGAEDMSDDHLIGRFDQIVDFYNSQQEEPQMMNPDDEEFYVDEDGNVIPPEDYGLYMDEDGIPLDQDPSEYEYEDESMYAQDSFPQGNPVPYQGVQQFGQDTNNPMLQLQTALEPFDKIRAEMYVAHGGT